MTGDELRAWREAHVFTQQQLAERLGVTANTVARWERGELVPSIMLRNALRWLEIDLRIRARGAERRRYRRQRRRFREQQRKRAETETPPVPPPDQPQMLSIDAPRLRQLLQLVHPDKHGGSKAANDITAWLLSQVRRR